MAMPKNLLITVPCYNEELVLEKTVEAICDYVSRNLAGFNWKILIIDNASSDKTWAIAQELEKANSGLILLVQEFDKGRGVAIRNAWLKFSGFDIYSYMDADLATDLKDFNLLVNKVGEGFDLVTGSRYLKESDIVRNPKREFLSRVYNFLLKFALGAGFKDAQCGFKAMSSKLVKEVFPQTRDAGWFWDTELMMLAMRQGYKVLEIPVSWREVRDELRHSTVSHWAEARRQLGNIYKMRKRLKKLNGN